METSSKPLLSPRLTEITKGCIVQTGGQTNISWHASNQPAMSTLRPHSKLRPCRSLDTRFRSVDGNETAVVATDTGHDDNDFGRITGSTSELAKMAAQPPSRWSYNRRYQETDESVVQSPREHRPQSAWKSRRQGRQPNFTFTDLAIVAGDADSGGIPVAPTTSRSGSFELSDANNEEIRLESLRLLRLREDGDTGGHSVDETFRTRLTRRERNVSPSVGYERDEVTVSPLPAYNADRRRRHSLYGGPSIVISSVPTAADDDEEASLSREAVADRGESHAGAEDCEGGGDDARDIFRQRSFTDTEHSAARKRALVRLTGNGKSTSSSLFRDAAEEDARIVAAVGTQRRRLSACRGQLPRKLDPLSSA